ncbi:histidine phosphatase family protein [Sinisalibacter aestuarii]|uniref:Histidine phosphatase family protein n=1 Tax=Sinisalibacter aestuarii TaxID=2949426 RepID=A0ABQ5LQC2_9RHOB|nr:histidine phosphatase family protein [Sinisalibacter aestuarii]GKY87197.1 hypothetical protein STA1M1_10660 [Sinisalibacter aestuarii]
MHRRTLLASIAATPLLAACGLPDTGAGTRLVVLRHTERTGENLNADGIARAAALPGALADISVDAIFAPDRQRNIDTATPLARARGLTVQVIPATDIARTMVTGRAGQTLVWVGNKDNLEALWAEIHAFGAPPIQYGELFIVSMNGLRAGRVEQRRFGA